MIAEVVESRQGNAPQHHITSWLDSAEFSWFFLITLIACAALLSLPLICWLRLVNRHQHPIRPWSLRVRGAGLPDTGQPLSAHPRRTLIWVTGFLLAGSILTLMNWLFLLSGWFAFSKPLDWLPALGISIVAAILVSIITEWIFRGVLLGIFLRSLSPALAILINSLIFSTLYLVLPEKNSIFLHGGEADAGVRYLVDRLTKLSADPGYLAGFTSMLIAGAILAYSRYRTASLALSTGILTGWLSIVIFSHMILETTPDLSTKLSLFVDPDRFSGAIPLSFIIATGLLAHVFTEMLARAEQAKSEG